MGEDAASWRSFSSHRTLVRAFALTLGVGLGQGCDGAAFECSNDFECRDGDRPGACEVDGYCSFPHDACASGRAYGSRAPAGLAGECVAPEAMIGSETSGHKDADDGSPLADSSTGDTGDAHRLHHDSGESTSTSSTGADVDDDDGESTTEVPSEPCGSCLVDADCSEGACESGTCRVRTTITTDWIYDCTAGDFEPLAVLPAGGYEATALPSAGSKWNHDDAVGGLTWAWWIDCDEVSFGDMRTPFGQWYATADDAFAALVATTTVIEHPGGTLSCGVIDNVCVDNRGGVSIELVSACD